MTAITNLSDLVNRMSGGNSGTPENLWFHKAPRFDGAVVAGLPVSGRPYSLWRMDGQPGPGAAPTTWVNPDNTTAGGLKQANPGGGRQKWLTQFNGTALWNGSVMLYDRLGHNGNLDGTQTAAQSFAGSITRYTNGVGNLMWYEIYGNTSSILGATSTTLTVQYDAPEGTNFVSPPVVIGGTGFREGNQARFIPLLAGHTGVIAVDNVDLLASTAVAGAFGITIAHPLAMFTVTSPGLGSWRDFATGLPGLPEIRTGACLALLFIGPGTVAHEVFGCVSSVEA